MSEDLDEALCWLCCCSASLGSSSRREIRESMIYFLGGSNTANEGVTFNTEIFILVQEALGLH